MKAVFRFQEFIWIMSYFILLWANFDAIFHLAMSRFCSCALCRVKAVVSNTKNCPAEGGSWDWRILEPWYLMSLSLLKAASFAPEMQEISIYFYPISIVFLSYFYIFVIRFVSSPLFSSIQVKKSSHMSGWHPSPCWRSMSCSCSRKRWTLLPPGDVAGETSGNAGAPQDKLSIGLQTSRKHLEFRWI